MAGHKSSHFSDDTWDVMLDAMTRREELEYLQMSVIVSAITTAGKMAGGGDPGDSLRNALRTYRGALFPEIQSDLLEKAKQNERILEDEYRKGPLKVQSLEYATKRKKQR